MVYNIIVDIYMRTHLIRMVGMTPREVSIKNTVSGFFVCERTEGTVTPAKSTAKVSTEETIENSAPVISMI